MSTNQRFCEQCGAPLPAGARFCEMCGAPTDAATDTAPERVIGHLPAERLEEGKGFLGRVKTTTINLIVTTTRLLFLRETEETNDAWLGETERLEEEEKRSGVPWRMLIDRYEWHSPLWSQFYETPPGELVAAGRDNEALVLADVASATVTLDEELDKLDIVLRSGETRRFQLFNLTGRPAARFLAEALGRERVRLASPAAS